MFRKIGFACSLLIISKACLAGNFYMGPMALIETVTATYSNSRGISPRLSLGYDQYLDSNFRLAAEIFGSPATISLQSNTPPGQFNAKIKRSYGASLLPAYMFNETIKGYARVGYISSKFNGPNKSSNGIQYGLGVSVKTSDCLDVRAEYDYISYNSVSNMGSPTSDFLGIGLIYNLDYL